MFIHFYLCHYSVLTGTSFCWWNMQCNIISCSEGIDSCQRRPQHQLKHWLEFQKYVFFLAWVVLWCFYEFHQAVNPSLFAWQLSPQERTGVNISVLDLFVLYRKVSWNFWLHISLRLKAHLETSIIAFCGEPGIVVKDWDGIIWKDNSYTQFWFAAVKFCFQHKWCIHLSSMMKSLVKQKSEAEKRRSPVHETHIMSVRDLGDWDASWLWMKRQLFTPIFCNFHFQPSLASSILHISAIYHTCYHNLNSHVILFT
jgi:hypothetical protein